MRKSTLITEITIFSIRALLGSLAPVLTQTRMVTVISSFCYLNTHTLAPGDPSSDPYGRSYNPSTDSHSTATSLSPFADPSLSSSEHYPAWSTDRQIPMSAEEIEDIFLDLTQKFGFQRDSMRNMVLLFPLRVSLEFTLLPPSTILLCTSLILVPPACLQIRPLSLSMQTT
jgi:hypothetical protein